MSERASSGVLPLVLLAMILVISAVAVLLGNDDARSAAGVDGPTSSAPEAARGAAAAGANSG